MNPNIHATPLILAIRYNRTEVADWLIASGSDLFARDAHGPNALHDAAKAGNLKLVKYLVEHGLNIDDADVNCDGAPLLCAALGDSPEVMDYLLSKGADIEQKGDGGTTALIAAASCGHLKAVKYLVSRGANVNARNDSWTSLAVAEKRHFSDLAAFLRANGATE